MVFPVSPPKGLYATVQVSCVQLYALIWEECAVCDYW